MRVGLGLDQKSRDSVEYIKTVQQANSGIHAELFSSNQSHFPSSLSILVLIITKSLALPAQCTPTQHCTVFGQEIVQTVI